MAKLILNFKSKAFGKIKNPKNYLGGKGVNLDKMKNVPELITMSNGLFQKTYPILQNPIFFKNPI